MRVLIVCAQLPVPPRSGSAIRILNILKHLSESASVEIAVVRSDESGESGQEALAPYCDEVYVAQECYPPKIIQRGRALLRLLKGEPYFTKYVESRDLRRYLGQVTASRKFDVIVFEHSNMATFLDCLHPNHGAKTVLVIHDIASILYWRKFASARSLTEKSKFLMTCMFVRRWESRMAARFDKLVAVSEVDKQRLLAQRPGLDITVVPNGVDTRENVPFSRTDRKPGLICVASMDYEPNVDAVQFLHRDILPLIHKARPACRLTIVGKSPPESVRRLDGRDGIEVRGDVPEVRPYYEQARVSVVPLRSGGGTRLKILEAMALGTPVVSTTVGCEGLDVQHGENILIADDPETFAQQVTALLDDHELWSRIAMKGRILVERRYDWRAIASRFASMLRQLSGAN